MRAAVVATTLAFALTGCASSGDSSFPSLREVPRGSAANTDAAHWAAVEKELRAAGQEVRSSPRAAPATATETPQEFLDEAREDLDEARESHGPQ